MVPFKEPHDGRFFVCEKMGLDVAFLGDYEEPETAGVASNEDSSTGKNHDSSRAKAQDVDSMMYT